MLTIFEINPEGWDEEILKGETLEQLIQEVTNYFGDWKDEEFIEEMIKSAKDSYKDDCNEYVNNCCNCICALDDELLRAEVEGVMCGGLLMSDFNYYDSLDLAEYWYGEGNIEEIELNIYKDALFKECGHIEVSYVCGESEEYQCIDDIKVLEYLQKEIGDKYELLQYDQKLFSDDFGIYVKFKIIAKVEDN